MDSVEFDVTASKLLLTAVVIACQQDTPIDNHPTTSISLRAAKIVDPKCMREVHCPASAEIKTGEVRLLIFRCFVFHQKHCSKFKPIRLQYSILSNTPPMSIYIYIPYIHVSNIQLRMWPLFFHRCNSPCTTGGLDFPRRWSKKGRRIWPLGKASTWSSSPPAADSFSPAPHAERRTRDERRETRTP